MQKLAPLFQVRVETDKGSIIAVGPKVVKEAAERLLEAINIQIIKGREKAWHKPHIVSAS